MERICPNCHAKNNPEARKCEQCGKTLPIIMIPVKRGSAKPADSSKKRSRDKSPKTIRQVEDTHIEGTQGESTSSPGDETNRTGGWAWLPIPGRKPANHHSEKPVQEEEAGINLDEVEEPNSPIENKFSQPEKALDEPIWAPELDPGRESPGESVQVAALVAKNTPVEAAPQAPAVGRQPVGDARIPPRSPGDKLGQYVITQAIPVQHTSQVVFYDAFLPFCQSCRKTFLVHREPFCPVCSNPFESHILRESIPNRLPFSTRERDDLRQVSTAGQHGFLPIQDMFDLDGKQVLVYPKSENRWLPLSQVPLPQPQELAITWCLQLGAGLKALHSRSLALFAEESPDIRSMVVINDQQKAFFTDLVPARPMADGKAGLLSRQRDIRTLARLLHLLVTGAELRARAYTAPHIIRKVIENARSGAYATIDQFLAALEATPAAELNRGLHQLQGHATHTGMLKNENGDFLAVSPLGSELPENDHQQCFYMIADGLGGYPLGEKAARMIIQSVCSQLQVVPSEPGLHGVTRPLQQAATAGEMLQEAVRQANLFLYRARTASSGGEQRTITLTAMLIQGDSATVANIGDTRTYLLRGGKLQQITRDHSMVAGLVSAGMITSDQARSHPQRNLIYRNLGDKPVLEIDIFPQVLQAGDQLFLCSDGLWEELNDDIIEAILLRSISPQSACDELLLTANASGSRDNISAIVVKLE